ncbi:hypothetical protein COO91_10791 (plasmid) [Nostoc flagelliforme CCNUN1]|uniref:Uncharacterized protein n=1 Tax=Nostoc flagelliforme CCNUN1 TaxID=2038116 RepID=A0A2K8TBV7_9NOSO|nr:hypothetical protein [Nostoc flagelliforme]AUB44555.1 hypothetical protein COO91_10791 [Nostoc flagelliforme CCNUN1]
MFNTNTFHFRIGEAIDQERQRAGGSYAEGNSDSSAEARDRTELGFKTPTETKFSGKESGRV